MDGGTILFFMLIVYLALCIGIGEIAKRTGRSAGAWCFLSIIFSPILAGPVLLLVYAVLGMARQPSNK